jgi:hypothetical protein
MAQEQIDPIRKIAALVGRSPIIRVLYSENGSAQQLQQHTLDAVNEIQDKGRVNIRSTAEGFADSMTANPFFKHASHDQLVAAMTTFIAAGYQIGNPDQALSARGMIVSSYDRLERGVIDSGFVEDLSLENHPVDILLWYGANLHMHEEGYVGKEETESGSRRNSQNQVPLTNPIRPGGALTEKDIDWISDQIKNL